MIHLRAVFLFPSVKHISFSFRYDSDILICLHGIRHFLYITYTFLSRIERDLVGHRAPAGIKLQITVILLPNLRTCRIRKVTLAVPAVKLITVPVRYRQISALSINILL